MHSFTLNIGDNNYTLTTYDYFSHSFGANGNGVESPTRDLIYGLLTPNSIFFDIGANVGLFSIHMSNKTDNVYAFEPTDTYENFLLPNLKNNNVNNVKTFKLAFGKQSGNFHESINKVWGVDVVNDDYQFITLDDFTKTHNVIPNFIKIDTDGYDYEILLGAENLLKNNNIILSVECNQLAYNLRGHNISDTLTFMNSIGYENFAVLDGENYFFRKKN